MYHDTDIVSLDLGFKDYTVSDEEVTIEELRLTTTDAIGELSVEELDNLKKRFKKIHYTILDRTKNQRGFGLTEEALQFYVDHFNKTKNIKYLHNFYKDHDYKHIDSLIGRTTNIYYDEKEKKVKGTTIIDLRHPTAKRMDMFKNLSATIAHGKPICSVCGKKYRTCDHIPNGKDIYPESTIAMNLEHSWVTIPAYDGAQIDSFSVFVEPIRDVFPDAFTSINTSMISTDNLNSTTTSYTGDWTYRPSIFTNTMSTTDLQTLQWVSANATDINDENETTSPVDVTDKEEEPEKEQNNTEEEDLKKIEELKQDILKVKEFIEEAIKNDLL